VSERECRRRAVRLCFATYRSDELQAAGTFEDLTALGPGQDDIDRQLEQLGTKSAVDEFADLKAELGAGEPTPEIEASGGSAPERP
jgi:hypothetical protein